MWFISIHGVPGLWAMNHHVFLDTEQTRTACEVCDVVEELSSVAEMLNSQKSPAGPPLPDPQV